MVGSVPHTRMTDAEGDEQLVPLRIVNLIRRQNKDGSWRAYQEYEVSCFRGDFNHMQRLFPVAETSINHGESTRFTQRIRPSFVTCMVGVMPPSHGTQSSSGIVNGCPCEA